MWCAADTANYVTLQHEHLVELLEKEKSAQQLKIKETLDEQTELHKVNFLVLFQKNFNVIRVHKIKNKLNILMNYLQDRLEKCLDEERLRSQEAMDKVVQVF